jgi:hypothetical protein
MDPPSTSCLVACAAGKPHCWPMGTRRDLGWALLRLSHWTSPSRASSRNRYAACPCNCKVFADGCRIRHMHRRLRSHSQRRDLSNQRLACTRHRHSLSLATYKRSGVQAHWTQEAACPSVDPLHGYVCHHDGSRLAAPYGLCRVCHPCYS